MKVTMLGKFNNNVVGQLTLATQINDPQISVT